MHSAILALGSLLLIIKISTLAYTLFFGVLRLPPSIVSSAAAAIPSSVGDVQANNIAPGQGLLPPTTQMASEPPNASPLRTPIPISDAERQILEDLRARRNELDTRERALSDRAALLDATEQRIKERVSQLSSIQARLEQLELARQQRDETSWSSIVKIYEVMKPKEAATIFNDIDMDVLVEIANRMKETKLSLILAAMQPDRARLLTTRIAGGPNHVPDPRASLPSAG